MFRDASDIFYYAAYQIDLHIYPSHTSIPATPLSQPHLYPSHTSIPATPLSQPHLYPSHTSIPATPLSQPHTPPPLQMPPAPTPTTPFTPSMNPSILVNQLLSEYDSINAMNTPQVKGTPTKCNISYDRLVKNPIRNFDDYGIAYPITGRLATRSDKIGGSAPLTDIKKALSETKVSEEFEKQASIAENGYYQGPDYSLGSNYFSVMGKCGPDSTPECQGQDRAVYIRNITTGSPPILADMSLAKLTNSPHDLASNGILPSMLDNISTFLPGNLIENVFQNKGNFGGSRCQRVKLPVGAHIYDHKMKVNLDYCAINKCDDDGSPPSLRVRQQRTRDQVYKGVLGVDTLPDADPASPNAIANRKTWWFEEHCSPSYNYAIVPNSWETSDNPLYINTKQGESAYLPGARPILGLGSTRSLKQLDPPSCVDNVNACPTTDTPLDTFVGTTVVVDHTAAATNPTYETFRRYGCVRIALVVVVLLVAVVWVGVRLVRRYHR